MFLCEGINILLSVHVSFASLLLKADGWSWHFKAHNLAEVVAQPETSCALCTFGKGWDPCGTKTGS